MCRRENVSIPSRATTTSAILHQRSNSSSCGIRYQCKFTHERICIRVVYKQQQYQHEPIPYCCYNRHWISKTKFTLSQVSSKTRRPKITSATAVFSRTCRCCGCQLDSWGRKWRGYYRIGVGRESVYVQSVQDEGRASDTIRTWNR